MEEAEASAKLTLEIIDRHPAVIHLPLTFTLAEASMRLLQTRARRNARPAPVGLHVDALHVAKATLRFARPADAAQETVGSGGREVGRRASGGWCVFGDAVLAAFDIGGGGDAGQVSAEVRGKELRNVVRVVRFRAGCFLLPRVCVDAPHTMCCEWCARTRRY